MFNDNKWISTRADIQYEHHDRWLELAHRNENKILLIESGAGTAVPTVRKQSQIIIKSNYKLDSMNNPSHHFLIRINIREAHLNQNKSGIILGKEWWKREEEWKKGGAKEEDKERYGLDKQAMKMEAEKRREIGLPIGALKALQLLNYLWKKMKQETSVKVLNLNIETLRNKPTEAVQ